MLIYTLCFFFLAFWGFKCIRTRSSSPGSSGASGRPTLWMSTPRMPLRCTASDWWAVPRPWTSIANTSRTQSERQSGRVTSARSASGPLNDAVMPWWPKPLTLRHAEIRSVTIATHETHQMCLYRWGCWYWMREANTTLLTGFVPQFHFNEWCWGEWNVISTYNLTSIACFALKPWEKTCNLCTLKITCKLKEYRGFSFVLVFFLFPGEF